MHSAITRLAVAGSVVLVLSHPIHAAAPASTNNLDGQQQPSSGTRSAEALRQTQEIIKAQPPREALQQRVPTCVVPDLSATTANRAQTVLSSANLRMGTVQSRESNRPNGTVVEQQPQPQAKVRCGATVNIWLALGPKNSGPGTSDGPPTNPGCVVPDVTGQLVEEIRKPLAERKFAIGPITPRESGRPRGMVLAQSPVSGTKAACGSQIAVVVAVPPVNHGDTQPERCVVPDLTGGEFDRVQRPLTRANLVLGSVRNRTFDVRPGTIIAQQPAPGTTVPCRTQVDVLVAVAPTVSCAPVPKLIGRDSKTAAALLESSGRRLGAVDERESNDAVGVILEQAPDAGATVACDTPVRVWIATPPIGIPVPTLLRNDERGARSALERVGLVMGEIGQRTSDQPSGSVIEQSPVAGTVVKRGSPVQVWLATPPPQVIVPDVRGQDRATASSTLTTARLGLGEAAERQSDRPAGTIVDQLPAPGASVRPGSPVQVWLATTPLVTVPDVRGMDRAAAFDKLSATRLQLGQTVDRQSDSAPGTIVEQTPAAGNPVRPGTPVHVWLAVPQPIKVPDVRGMNRAAAVDALSSARLRLGDVADRPSERAPATIVEQTPTAGTVVGAGSAVQVWQAVAPPSVVPDVRGKDRAGAAQILTTARLRLGEVGERQSDRAVGSVVEQVPSPGVSAAAGTEVQVWLAVPITIEVPDVTGRTRADAVQMLSDRGLALRGTTSEPSPTTSGTVLRQAPPAGARVSPGSAVDLVLATVIAAPTLLTPVPDLTGLSRDQAREILQAAGLQVGLVREIRARAAIGTVTSQAPRAGTNVSPGAAVDFDVARFDFALLWMLAAGLGLGAAAAGMVSRARKGGRQPSAALTLAPHADSGVQTTIPDGRGLVSAELSLEGFGDEGIQTLQGPPTLVLDVAGRTR